MQRSPKQTVPHDAAGFYATRRGGQVISLLMTRLAPILPDPTGLRVLGLGYSRPLLAQWQALDRARWVASAQLDTPITRRPDAQILTGRAIPSCIVAPDCMPFDDLSLDLVVLVHGLELVDPHPLLRLVWKMLADHGRLVLIVPNRTGFAAADDSLPFGHGSPFSASQLDTALQRAMFHTEACSSALGAPQTLFRFGERAVRLGERMFGLLGRNLGGLHLITACKDLYSGMPIEPERARLAFRRQLAPLASPLGRYQNEPQGDTLHRASPVEPEPKA